MPDPSPHLLRSQAVAREIEATLGRIERKLDRLDITTARAAADLRAEVAGTASALRSEARGLRGDTAILRATAWAGFVGLALVLLAAYAMAARGFGLWGL